MDWQLSLAHFLFARKHFGFMRHLEFSVAAVADNPKHNDLNQEMFILWQDQGGE